MKLPQIGVTKESYAEEREAIYEELWGEAEQVSHEVLPLVPHVDVYLFPSEYEGSPLYRLVTGGMSDLPMELPDGTLIRAELIMYVREPKEQYIEMLRFLAHYPHANQRWLSYGHTIPNGNPPKPFFPRSQLSVVLLSETIVTSDRELTEKLHIQETPVDLLWVTPITEAECNLKLEQGVDALYEAFNRHELSFVLDERRTSCV